MHPSMVEQVTVNNSKDGNCQKDNGVLHLENGHQAIQNLMEERQLENNFNIHLYLLKITIQYELSLIIQLFEVD